MKRRMLTANQTPVYYISLPFFKFSSTDINYRTIYNPFRKVYMMHIRASVMNFLL